MIEVKVDAARKPRQNRKKLTTSCPTWKHTSPQVEEAA
jgi:hypothetical protein